MLPLLFALLVAGGAPPDFPAAAPGAGVEVTLLVDLWPARPRILAYEYNQKNHHDVPQFVGGVTGAAVTIAAPKESGKRYRLVGVRLANPGDTEVKVRLRSKQIQAGKEIPVTLPPRDFVARHFVIKEPKDRKLAVEVSNEKGEPLASGQAELLAEGRTARRPEEIAGIAEELDREDFERRRFQTRPVRITVHDDLELPVPAAHLLLLLADGMMVYEGDTDAAGEWRGNVMPGAYEVFAFAEVPDRTDVDAATAVTQLPRLLVVRGDLAADGSEAALRPDRTVEVATDGGNGGALVPGRTWITPGPLVEAYRYELVARTIDKRARIDSARTHPGGRFLLLTSAGLASLIAASATFDDGVSVLLRADTGASAKEALLPFSKERSATLVIDPTKGAGPGEWARVSLVALDGVRERIDFECERLHMAFLPAGQYRVELRYRLAGGTVVEFLPYRLTLAAGDAKDLTPRGPFDLPIYWMRDGKRVQFWLAVIDAEGRVLAEAPSGGRLTATFRGETIIDRAIGPLRFEYAEGFEGLDLAKLDYDAFIGFGDEPIRGTPHLERTTIYNVEGQSAEAPGCVGARAEALLPEVKKSIEGCLAHLGLPDGIRRLHIEFEIFLPPGMGGTGGGGNMTLELPALFGFTGATDLLPGPYRHELGHNLGFGHDPYMLLAPSGVDEPRFGAHGYRLLRAAEFQRTLRYLEGDRSAERDPWAPSEGVFSGLRLLFGPDVHVKMLTERRASEQTMVLHGLSTIERIATLYSLVLERNVAWIFRAHGWPVFDERVDLGARAVRELKEHPLALNYGRLDGTPISSWWVFGPVRSRDESALWRRVAWPSVFTRLDEDRAPADETQHYLFFRRIRLPKAVDARLVCASDVQLELRLNGAAVALFDASPQFSQPAHDEGMLNQKRASFVHLYEGENMVEVAATQPPGSRGFLVELLDEKGEPIRIALDDDPPDGCECSKKISNLEPRNAVMNESFELGAEFPTAWLAGPIQPASGIEIALDPLEKTEGTRSLRLRLATAANGGVIQRVVVEPGKKYRLGASLRTEGLDGETFVGFFTDDVNTHYGKTEPIREALTAWSRYEANWFAGTTRVIYLVCYLRGKSGTVWFDDIVLDEAK